MREQTIYTPTQISRYIKGIMDRDAILSGVLVQGELSNYKLYPSGHHYFSLKDSEGTLRCVMFRGDATSLRFRPQNGMSVIAAGRVSAFPRDGQYQLYCVRLTPEGAGDLHVAFEQLKAKLLQEGLFAQEKKQPLPRYPAKIALITSPAGAAIRDMLRILKTRYPMANVCVVPVRVQGETAAEEIAAAIRWANLHQIADLIITGRGGGSTEDLWAFNEEVVARAIYDSKIPIISAVGHEPDVTISDFVADLRAATPSNAAELAVPDQNELKMNLDRAQQRMTTALNRRMERAKRDLNRMQSSRMLQDPANLIRDRQQQIEHQNRRLCSAMEQLVLRKKERFGRLAAGLDAMSPLRVLGRGYAIAENSDGTALASVQQVDAGDRVVLRLTDGTIGCCVETIKPDNENGGA